MCLRGVNRLNCVPIVYPINIKNHQSGFLVHRYRVAPPKINIPCRQLNTAMVSRERRYVMARLLVEPIMSGHSGRVQGVPSTCQRKGKIEWHYCIEGVNEEGGGEKEGCEEKMGAQVPVPLDREATLHTSHNARFQRHDQHCGHKDDALSMKSDRTRRRCSICSQRGTHYGPQ